MASTIKVDQIEGSTGSTVTIPTGQTLTITDGLAIGSIPTITVAKGGTNTTSYAAGDILYASGATTLTKLVKGSDDDVLTLASGVPSWAAAAGGGKIGQVLSASKIDTESMTSSSFTDVSDLSVTITPVATNSKIFWTFTVAGGDNTNYGIAKIVYGDGSDLTTPAIHEAAGSRIRGTSGWAYTPNAYETAVLSGQGLDSPATTSATTYKIQIATGGTFYVNRTVTWLDNSTTFAGIGTLTVMEVLA